MKTHRMSRFFLGTVLIITMPLAIANKAITQPAPPERSITPSIDPPQSVTPRVAPVRTPVQQSDRDMERAWRDIVKAEEEAYQVSALATELASAEASDLASLADRLLSDARANYESGNYFQAAETALAAKDTYEAAETLYEGELGYVLGQHGAEGPSRSYYDAPYRIAEELSRAEAEAAYYQSNDSTAIDLLRRARELARPADLATSTQPVAVSDFTSLTNNRAAIHLAKAATHLMQAERGF